ncbi:MAG: hypothetical protein ACE5KE_07240 [Methanosarcinales archaeon]
MQVELNKADLRELLLDSYGLIMALDPPKKKNNKYEIESKSKLRSLPEALREFEDPSAEVAHFVKHASYFLPRSNLNRFLDNLLEKINKIQKNTNQPEIVKEKVRYLIGYTNWGIDAILNVFNNTNSETELKQALDRMISAELEIVGASEKEKEEIVNKIMEWKK